MHWDEDERNEFPKYTVGVINDSYAVIGYFDYKYSYEYDGEIFERTGSGNKKMNDKIGMKYIVKISSKNPKNAVLFTELRVCDTLGIVPRKGWTKIPDGIICKKTNANTVYN